MKQINFELAHHKIAGLTCGDDSLPKVLAIHGWLDNAASFSPLSAYWQDHFPNHQLVAIDLPGHGYSDHLNADGFYHFVDWVDVLLQLFELNNWQNIPIIGHSMGGMIATAFTAAFPEKVEKLCLIEAIGFVTGKENEASSQLRKGLQSRRQLPNKTQAQHSSIESAINARVNVSDLSHKEAAILVERGLCADGEKYSWRSDPRLRLTTPLRITLEQAKSLCSAVQCPVKVIHGKNGFDMVKSGIAVYGQLMAKFSAVEVDGGHHPHMEHPEQVIRQIADFLTELN